MTLRRRFACAPWPTGRVIWLAVSVFSASAILSAYGVARADDPRKASTSRAARQQALKALAWNKIADPDRATVRYVIENTSIYRRLPTKVIDCDPDLYDFFLENPDVITSIWDAMRISNVDLKRTGDNTFQYADGEGTRGQLRVLYRSFDNLLVLAQGTYDGPLVARPVTAHCLMLLRSHAIRETNDRSYITSRLDTFIHVDQIGVELFAKTFHPLLGRAADYNFTETMQFVAGVSRTAELNPSGVARLTTRLDLSPGTRQRFTELSAAVAARSSERRQSTRPVDHDEPVRR